MQEAILALPDRIWEPAYDASGQVRPGAWVAELTGLLDLTAWPEGMRVIVRKERPHPGAQLRFTDINGHRFTAFATGARRGQLADLELRHRRRARCEDRIRAAKDTGLRNLPLHGFAQNQIWCELVAMASELLAWMQMLRPRRPRPRLGTQTPAAASVRHRRAPGPRRPASAAAPVRDLALGAPAHRSDHPPAGLRPQLTSPDRPYDQEGQPQGPWNPAHPARQPGSQARPDSEMPPGHNPSQHPGIAGIVRRATVTNHAREAERDSNALATVNPNSRGCERYPCPALTAFDYLLQPGQHRGPIIPRMRHLFLTSIVVLAE